MTESLKKFFWEYGDLQVSLKSWFALVFAMLIIVDFVIVLDIPIIRPVLALLYFTIVPGLLLLEVLQLTGIGYAKRFIVGFGVSVAFLMFGGLIFNEIYLAIGIPNPVSVEYMVPSFTLVVALLILAAYHVDTTRGENVTIPNPRSIVSSSADGPLLMFSMLFPFLAIFGTYFMNTQGNNAILIILLLLIAAYIIVLVAVARRMKVTEIVYPAAILMISVALLLKHGLTSSYPVGADVHGEYLAYQAVVNNQYWSLPAVSDKLTATLSTSILPAVLQVLSGVSGVYMFKAVFQLIFSVTPVAVYFVARRYVNQICAFLASVFFMAQVGFMFTLQDAMREEIAVFFLTLAVLVYVAQDIRGFRGSLLFLLFASAIVFSHYSVALTFILVLALALVLALLTGAFARLRHHPREPNSYQTVSFAAILILAALFFLWWSQISAASLNFTIYLHETLSTFQAYFVTENAGVAGQIGIAHALGYTAGIADSIRAYTYDLVFVISGIGALIIFVKGQKKFFKTGYAFFALASALLLLMWFFLPGPAGYSVTRISQDLLVFLVVPFVIGVYWILKTMRINKQRYFVAVVLLLVLVQFASTTYLFDQAMGVPTSMDLNRSGTQADGYYIYPGDEAGANWLANYMHSNSSIAANAAPGGLILTDFGLSSVDPFSHLYSTPNDSPSYRQALSYVNNSYLYLSNLNVVRGDVIVYSATGQGIGSSSTLTEVPLANFSQIYSAKDKVYDNGQSIIYQ